MSRRKALDLFAGAGGWDVAAEALGWDVDGVEIMPEAQATRAAAGFKTIESDVRNVDPEFGAYDLVIASPPCQSFSMAGKGVGRQALDAVLAVVATYRQGSVPMTYAEAAALMGDDRTALVVEPLRIVLACKPRFVAWEQVPAVLPVWQACGDILREHGYSVAVGVVSSEQYGVPQTRRRAILVARRDEAEAVLPTPTHSKYHLTNPSKLDDGVLPWVSMAEALGWGMTGRPSMTVTGGGSDTGGAEPFGNAARQGMAREIEAGHWALRNGSQAKATVRQTDLPSGTLFFGERCNAVEWVQRSNYSSGAGPGRTTAEERGRTIRNLDQPSVTLTGKPPSWQPGKGIGDDPEWPSKRPSTTVLGDARIAAPGHRDRSAGGEAHHTRSMRVTVQEAAVLQTFPADHPFQGNKGRKYLQVGNAVPPLLARAILSTFDEGSTEAPEGERRSKPDLDRPRRSVPVMRTDPPVRPAMQGTYALPSLGGCYTIGQEHAIDAAEHLAPAARPLAVDIETFGLGRDAMRLKAVTIGTADHAVILDPRDERQAAMIRWALSVAPALAIHNAPYDVPLLVRNGLMHIADVEKVWDTLVWARLADPGERNSFRLADCAHAYLGTPKGDVLENAFAAMGFSRAEGYRVFDLDRPIYVHGAALDVLTTARIFPLVRSAAWRRLTEGHPFDRWGVQGGEAVALLNREQRINRIFIRRSCKGLRVDLDYLDRYRDEVRVDRAAAQELLDRYGMEASKPAKLTEWLDGEGLIPEGYPTTPGGAISGDKNHLARIDHPLVSAFLLVKQADKIEADYLQKVVDLADSDDRIHATTSILGASATGRMSMSDPPLQQFPGDVLDDAGHLVKRGARGIIMCDPGDPFTSIDWSQIEPVVAANIAHDLDVLAGYEAGTSDLYTDIGEFAGVKRKTAKVILLAQMYGEGLSKLAADLRISTDEAKGVSAQVMGAMPKTATYLRQLRAMGREHQLIFTLSGRIVPVPMGLWDGQWSVQSHKAINYTIQGSAYDVLAETIIAIDDAGLSDALYLAMHDELVVSTSAAHDVQRIMQTPPARLIELAGRTPVLRTDRADMGERWAAV